MIGYTVRKIRCERGMTQTELAEKCGCTQPNIAYIESNGKNPKMDLLIKLANALRVSVNDLLD